MPHRFRQARLGSLTSFFLSLPRGQGYRIWNFAMLGVSMSRPGEGRDPYGADSCFGTGAKAFFPLLMPGVDGVDGPLRHRMCQNEVVEISDKGAVREPDYPHWNGNVGAFFSVARG